jgi:DNA segregation ATPase FtsK/SpoIIIE, S-DNA-T family
MEESAATSIIGEDYMSQLWIFYEDTCQLFPLTGQEDCIFIGNKLEHHITIPSFLFHNGYVEIRKQTDASVMTMLQGDKPIGELKPYAPFTVNDDGQTITVVWMDKEIKQHIYYVGNKIELMVAPDPQADIQTKAARVSFVKQQGE